MTIANVHAKATGFNQFLAEKDVKDALAKLRGYMSENSLIGGMVFTAESAAVDGLGQVENYQFIVTRRFFIDGELHLGGANGEIVNVDAMVTQSIEDFKKFSKRH
ncbi:MAG: hypothetical protein H9W81_07820 [Enterococcus sp.]|nr:hypothetical protein [Enterococcus sp.]